MSKIKFYWFFVVQTVQEALGSAAGLIVAPLRFLSTVQYKKIFWLITGRTLFVLSISIISFLLGAASTLYITYVHAESIANTAMDYGMRMLSYSKEPVYEELESVAWGPYDNRDLYPHEREAVRRSYDRQMEKFENKKKKKK
jgi:hypothetical protein